MTTNHTQGQWSFRKNGRDTYITAPTKSGCNPVEIAKVRAANGLPVEANARLIAAAPDLLAAVQEFIDCGAYAGSNQSLIEQCLAAIAKARG